MRRMIMALMPMIMSRVVMMLMIFRIVMRLMTLMRGVRPVCVRVLFRRGRRSFSARRGRRRLRLRCGRFRTLAELGLQVALRGKPAAIVNLEGFGLFFFAFHRHLPAMRHLLEPANPFFDRRMGRKEPAHAARAQWIYDT